MANCIALQSATSKVFTGWLARLAGHIDRLSADARSSLKTFEVLMPPSARPLQSPLMALLPPLIHSGGEVRQRQRELLLHRDVFQLHTVTGPQTLPRLFNPLQERRIMFEPIFKPVIFRFKADQNARRLAVTGDDQLFLLGQPEIPGQIIFDFRQCDKFHASWPIRLRSR